MGKSPPCGSNNRFFFTDHAQRSNTAKPNDATTRCKSSTT